MKAFPDAKVVLSVRNPETWYQSVKDTVYKSKEFYEDFALRTFMRLNGMFEVTEVATKTSGAVPKGLDKGKDNILFEHVTHSRLMLKRSK